MSVSATPVDGGPALRSLRRLIDFRPGEGRALAWSWTYVFALFLAYYVLRPIRDELGAAGGVGNLPWLFTGTMLAMIAANPLFSLAVRRWPRETFIAVSYRFFMLNLVAFMALLALLPPEQRLWVGRAFFIWVSVFNLFVVSVFWSFIVDVFDENQGKRLFGFLAAGATLGGLVGAAFTSGLVTRVGQHWLLLAAIVFLELAVYAARRLSRISARFGQASGRRDDSAAKVGGGMLAGLTHTFRSPYLLGIAAFVLLYTITSTFLYFHQAALAVGVKDHVARTAFFASIDFWVNLITLAVQLLLTGRLIRWFGVIAALCVLPFASLAGFVALAASPTIAVFVAVQVARRVANFALARPSREILFTCLPREDRYKAKNFIDTVIYRGGDQLAGWAYAGLLRLGFGITGIAVLAVSLSAAWLLIGFWLGGRAVHEARARRTSLGCSLQPVATS